MEVAIKYKCTSCGAETDWDFALGDNPICVTCWDRGFKSANKRRARDRRYYQKHKAERTAYQRRYYQEHKDEVARVLEPALTP